MEVVSHNQFILEGLADCIIAFPNKPFSKPVRGHGMGRQAPQH
jgi:hypothetical protein